MPLLMLQEAHLAFGDNPLLNAENLSLENGDRLGVIGRNGAGKSSMLKVLAGTQPLDGGLRVVQKDINLIYVPQESVFSTGETIRSVLTQGVAEVAVLVERYYAVSAAMAEDYENEALMEEMQHLQHQIDLRDGWRVDAAVDEAIMSFGLAGDILVDDLSGGWKKRLAIAQALIAKPDVLLLDEPTNHLDVAGIEVLEQTLKNFNGAVILISHDRQFLDNTVNGLLELDRGVLRRYPGSFSVYQERKVAELASEEVTNALFDKHLAQEEVWIRQGIKARRTRNEGRVRQLEQLRRERAERRKRQGMAKIAVDTGKKSGALVAELENVSLAFDGWTIFKDVSTLIQRGDKVGLIGPNGVGKTTFIKLVLGEIQPDSGMVKTGTQLQVAYLDQQRAVLNDEDMLIDAVREGSDFIEINGQKKHILGYLEDFLFPPHRARVKVGSLSGGERARLLLAKLFTKPANMLILDEPTNDLDLETLELLEELIQNYQGTVLLVSHDRSFVDNVVTQSLAFVGDGRIVEVAGGYEDWAMIKHQYIPEPQLAAESLKPVKAKDSVPLGVSQQLEKKIKLTYKEQKELDALPGTIATLEAEQANLSEQLCNPIIFADISRLEPIQRRLQELEQTIEQAMNLWAELESKQT
jgi:ABC transport system ATP-binding/permease protein